MTTNGAALSKIKKKLLPPTDGTDVLRLRTAVVAAIGSDGTVDITLSGATITDVPVLGSARFAVGSVVQVASYRGSLIILGPAAPTVGNIAANTYSSTDTGTTTSATFVTSLSVGTAATGVTFIAPASGIVAVIARAAASNDTAGSYALMDFQVREGSTLNAGSVFRAANENTAGIIRSSTANLQATIVSTDRVNGLVPGNPYNVTLAFHVGSGGTASYNRRHALVLPQ